MRAPYFLVAALAAGVNGDAEVPAPAPPTYNYQQPAGYGYQQPVNYGYQQPAPADYGYQQQAPAGYGYQPQAPADYGYQQQAPADYGYQQPDYGNDDYPESVPRGYGYAPYDVIPDRPLQYSSAYDPVYPEKAEPAPFVELYDEEQLALPNFDHYHCFLTGAPWTTCGGRTLRAFFLDQCLGFLFSASASVDGICSSNKPKPAAAAPSQYGYPAQPANPAYPSYGAYPAQPYGNPIYSQYSYGGRTLMKQAGEAGYQNPQPAQPYNPYYQYATPAYPGYTAAPAAPVYTAAPATQAASSYSEGPAADYQQERCLQSTYTSITLATVMCLTENIIRIEYIEHYVKDAECNPVEGPLLYLKKLHEFVKKVLECNGDKAKNYPSLWTTFKDGNRVAYNPNAPYIIGDDLRVSLPKNVDKEASGWNDIIAADRFLCNNIEDIDGSSGYYVRDAEDFTYDRNQLVSCDSSLGYEYTGKSGDAVLKRCDHYSGGQVTGYGSLPSKQYSNPQTLRGLYDGVDTITNQHEVTIRSRTIAETAAYDSGILGQPILEGYGILYFCAFYACKANNGGNVDGTCFPTFSSQRDWQIKHSDTSVAELNKLSSQVVECVAHKWITKDFLKEKAKSFVEELNTRTHICLAENEIVDFFNTLEGGFSNRKQDAWQLVFLRKIVHEKCYTHRQHECRDITEYYNDLHDLLESLVQVCNAQEERYNGDAAEFYKSGGYGGAYGYGGDYNNYAPK